MMPYSENEAVYSVVEYYKQLKRHSYLHSTYKYLISILGMQFYIKNNI